MRKRLMYSCLLLLAIFTICCNYCIFNTPYNVYGENLTSAKSMVVIEQNSNRILYEKDCNKKLPMASTTKIVTALTVLDNCDNLDEKVNVHDDAIGIEGTSIYLKKGEILTVRELLYGLILASGNDSAMALAYHIGNDIPTFCKMMKGTAEKCGATNSNFTNPHGLDADGHYTTALDLAKITAVALKNNDFKEIIETKNTRITGSSEGTYRYLKNKNRLLWSNEFCNGVKTGFTDNAGRCFVGSATKNNMTIISVVLNCGSMFEETEYLFEKAFNEYEMVELLKPYKFLKEIAVKDGKEECVKLYTKKGFSYPLTESEKNKISVNINIPQVVVSPVEKEQIVGNIDFYLKNKLLFSEKIYTMDSVKSIRFLDNFKTIINKW